MRKLPLLALLILMFAQLPPVTYAQSTDIQAELANNVILRSGPGMDTAWIEYLAAGRDVLVTGRDTDGSWLQLLVSNQMVGWVPRVTVYLPADAKVSNLPIRPGFRDEGNGPYSITDRALRSAEIDIIRLQRAVYATNDRYFRLQAGLPTSCSNIPAIPAAPIADYDIGRIPELDTVFKELTYVQQQIGEAIKVFQQLCSQGSDYNLFITGLGYNNNARNTLNNVRAYVNILGGLEEGVW